MADNWMLKAVLSANASGMLGTLKAVNTATRTTRKYLLDVGKSATALAGQVGLPLGLIGGALSAFSIAGVQQAIAGFAELTGQISDSAKGLKLTAEEYQRIVFIASQSGVAADVMGASMGRLNKNIAMAGAGKNKDFASMLSRLRISLRDSNGELRTATDLLPEIAEKFSRNKNAGAQALIGNVMFGKSWQALAPLLSDGKQGIDDLTARYKQLGLVIDNDTVAAGEAFGDQVEQLQMVIKSYGNTITAKLLPALSPLIEKTILWAVKNRDLITTNISNFITDMAASLEKVDWKGVIDGVKDFVKSCKSLIDWLGGAKNALIALAVVMNMQTIAAFFGLIGATWRLVWGLGVLTVTAVPAAITSVRALGAAMLTTGTAANAMLGLLGKIGLVAGAGFIGWEIGTKLNENIINPATKWLTNGKNDTLGGAIYDAMNPTVNGEITVKFENSPPGMRIEQASGNGPLSINTDVGTRSFATGMPY